ncbi:hypothetical protein TSAR_009991, partial [Trichomalopsis sarcophagae]
GLTKMDEKISLKKGQTFNKVFRRPIAHKFQILNPKHVKTFPNFNTNLVYTRLVDKCKFGDYVRSRGKGERATSTCRFGCKAFIKLNAFFHMLPENRLDISNVVLNDIKDKLNVRGNKKVIQSELHKQKIFLNLKDLTNIKSRMKTVNGDNLQKTVDYLIDEKNAIVEIY